MSDFQAPDSIKMPYITPDGQESSVECKRAMASDGSHLVNFIDLNNGSIADVGIKTYEATVTAYKKLASIPTHKAYVDSLLGTKPDAPHLKEPDNFAQHAKECGLAINETSLAILRDSPVTKAFHAPDTKGTATKIPVYAIGLHKVDIRRMTPSVVTFLKGGFRENIKAAEKLTMTTDYAKQAEATFKNSTQTLQAPAVRAPSPVQPKGQEIRSTAAINTGAARGSLAAQGARIGTNGPSQPVQNKGIKMAARLG